MHIKVCVSLIISSKEKLIVAQFTPPLPPSSSCVRNPFLFVDVPLTIRNGFDENISVNHSKARKLHVLPINSSICYESEVHTRVHTAFLIN